MEVRPEPPPTLRRETMPDQEHTPLERQDAGDEPRVEQHFDPASIRMATRESSVETAMERIRRGGIELAPDFQRSGDIWSRRKQSRLIESFLLRIPMPAFYVASDPNDNWQVVVGVQRLGTLRSFIIDKRLRLSGLEYLSRFEGHDYDRLPRPMQRRITETRLTCHVIETGTPPEVMFNIFKRIVEAVGRPFAGQEIRHALNPGPVRDLLRELAESRSNWRAFGSQGDLAADHRPSGPKHFPARTRSGE